MLTVSFLSRTIIQKKEAVESIITAHLKVKGELVLCFYLRNAFFISDIEVPANFH